MASTCSYSRVVSGKTTSKRGRRSVTACPGSVSASTKRGTGSVKIPSAARHRAVRCKSFPRRKTSRSPAIHGDCPHGVLDDSARNVLRTFPPAPKSLKESAQKTAPVDARPRSAMDQHGDLAMGEDLDRLAAEHDRGNATAAVRGHDDQVAAFQSRGSDDRLVGMLMFDLDRLACDAGSLRSAGD